MKRVTGIGGIFFKAKDAPALCWRLGTSATMAYILLRALAVGSRFRAPVFC